MQRVFVEEPYGVDDGEDDTMPDRCLVWSEGVNSTQYKSRSSHGNRCRMGTLARLHVLGKSIFQAACDAIYKSS